MKFKKEVSLGKLQISRRIATSRSGRDDPSVEKSTRLLEVSGRERKIKTPMNTGGCAAQKWYMLRSQRLATEISINAEVIMHRLAHHSHLNFDNVSLIP